jgi:hypothetical protein
MTEQKRLFFEVTEGDIYVDMAAALSASNRKQYHQMKRDGTPFNYHFTISSHGARNGGQITVCALAPNWTTRNACKKAAAGWKTQLRHADVKISDLPRYGRNARFALEADATDVYTLTSGKTVQGLAKNLSPQDCSGAELFNSYNDTAGDAITYSKANTIVTVPVPDATTGAVIDQPMVMIADGATADQFEIIPEFLGSRRNVETLETDAPGVEDTNKMTSLFATAEELSDDIIENVQDFADNRPYDITSADDLHMVGTCGIIRAPDPADQANTLQVPVSLTGEAPLGLLKLSGLVTGDEFTIDVHAIVEM